MTNSASAVAGRGASHTAKSSATSATRQNIHATGMVLGGRGVILRGPPGGGKSLLALELIDEWELRGLSSALVGDDRIDIEVDGDHLVMHAPKAIEGLIELRGRGIVSRPFVRAATVQLVVDLVDVYERMVEEDALTTIMLGIELPRCPVPRTGKIDSRHQLLLVREALRAMGAADRGGVKAPKPKGSRARAAMSKRPDAGATAPKKIT